jgi:hypothetical protein
MGIKKPRIFRCFLHFIKNQFRCTLFFAVVSLDLLTSNACWYRQSPMMPKLEIYCLLYFLGEPVSAAILAALTVQQRTVGFAGAVSSLPPKTNVSEGGLTLLLCALT